MKINPC